MSELHLAGNFIDISGLFKYGHLQIVFIDDDGTQREIEVQSPPSGFFGTWTYPEIRDHTNLLFTPNYGDEPIRYASTKLELGNRSAESVWKPKGSDSIVLLN